jgi:cytochrome c oxidase subunit 3
MSTDGRRHGALAPHFDSFLQQRETASLGMWAFLITEVMFFGALFAAYTSYRWAYPEAFAAASRRLDVELGTLNTAILLTSSLTMALSVRASALGRRKTTAVLLFATLVLGVVFLGIKGYEYHAKAVEHLLPGHDFVFPAELRRGAELFICLYFAMTGLHALHMIVGVGLIAGTIAPAWLGWFTPENHNWVEGMGLYWHFVDIVWIFLFPLLYLVGHHHG